jgi:hypothetical protein
VNSKLEVNVGDMLENYLPEIRLNAKHLHNASQKPAKPVFVYNGIVYSVSECDGLSPPLVEIQDKFSIFFSHPLGHAQLKLATEKQLILISKFWRCSGFTRLLFHNFP